MLTGTLAPVSNQENWDIIDSVLDADTGAAVDLTGAVIVFEVRSEDTGQTVLSATTGNGKITIIDTGVYQVSFTRADMQALCKGYYDVGCVITLNGKTQQFIAGTLPVLDGIVTQ
jgi:hypothetical protein